MHPSPEPSLPVLVVPGMKDLRTNEVLSVLICLKTRARFENFARTDGELAAGAGEDTASEAAAARASCHTDDAVLRFFNLLVQNFWYKVGPRTKKKLFCVFFLCTVGCHCHGHSF